MYGRGERSIAEQLGCSKEEAKEIKDNVYLAFPNIKKFENDSSRMVKEKGYVTTLWGRKRRLPDYNLPNYECYYMNEDGSPDKSKKIPDSEYQKIVEKLDTLYWKKKDEYIEMLKEKYKICVIDNNSKIAAAGRQIINSRVQGCLSGETNIITKELGTIPIENVSNRSDLHVWDGKNWTRCDILPSGKKQKCIIEFEDGQKIICSPDHKFKNGTTWKKCSELKTADIIEGYNNTKIIKRIDFTNKEIDMYDVCNTENGYFVANDLITHNSSADMSKLACIKIHNDEELIKRKIKIIVPVHDEILIETPLRYAKYVKDRFANDMETAAKPKLTIPISCDVVSAVQWYGDELDLNEELKGLEDA